MCDFHSLRLCSCGEWDEDNIKCEGKAYKTRNVLSCPFHSLAYQIECDRRADQAEDVIHPVLGRGHTNQSEASQLFDPFSIKVFAPQSPSLPGVH